MTRIAGIALGMMLLAGCGGGDGSAFLQVRIDPPTPAVTGIARLDVTVNMANMDSRTLTLTPDVGTPTFTLPKTVALEITDRSGPALVKAVARNGSGGVIVMGAKAVTVIRGTVQQVTVALGVEEMLPDAGVMGPDAAVNPPVLQLSPSGLKDFGIQTINTSSATQLFTVSNSGGTQSGTLSLPMSVGDFAITQDMCNNRRLAPGSSCTFNVHFNPAAVGSGPAGGDKAEILTISVVDSASLTAALRGKATCFSITPTSHNFGNVQQGTPSTARAFMVRNECSLPTGAIDMPRVIGTQAAAFAVTGGNCTAMMLGGLATCGLDVTFTPSAVEPFAADLEVKASAGNGGALLTRLSGTGVQ